MDGYEYMDATKSELLQILYSLQSHWNVIEDELIEINKDIAHLRECLRKYGEHFRIPLEYLKDLKKEKKEILDDKQKEQIDLIKSFSKKEIKLATIKEIENFQKQSDLSENSTQLNPNLLSESYAKLLAQQGKNKKAKEIYQKLMVKFPDKNIYFADLIKGLDL